VKHYKDLGFEIGKGLVSTKEAEHYGVFKNRTLGVMRGFSRDPKIILVTVLGSRSLRQYHWTFWRPLEAVA
jgi:hypothetical protein